MSSSAVNGKLGASEEIVVEASRWRICGVAAVAMVFREETEIGIVVGGLQAGILATTNYYAQGTAMILLDDAFKFSGPPFIDVSQVNAALGYQIIIRNAVGSIGPKAIVLCAVPSNSVIVCS